ncbi:MAG: hypothetical protein ACC707_19195, partial [Thiohalomonadales bacterium]
APTDSSLLLDSVRVMVRLLKHLSETEGAPTIEFVIINVLLKNAHGPLFTRKNWTRKRNSVGISCLKRAYGLSICTWKGLEHFTSYVWSSAVPHYLALLARLAPT